MGRTILCEESAIEPLTAISHTQGFIPGLIIGQYTENKDFVIHLPRTPVFGIDDVKEDCEPIKEDNRLIHKVADIDENYLLDQCRTVTRMLPGGMWILGLYIISPGDIFSDKNSFNKLRTLANTVNNCTKTNEHLCGRDPSNQKLILHFCSLSKKYTCKSLDLNTLTSTFRPADWKIKSNITTWLKVKSNINLSWLPLCRLSTQTDKTKVKLQEVLDIYRQYLDGMLCSIEGEFLSSDTLLTTVQPTENWNSAKEVNEQEYKVMLYEKPVFRSNKCLSNIRANIKLCGIIKSEVYLNSKSTVGDAVKTLKDDLLRSLASRFEMHWQTFEAPLEKRPYIIRQPPRRILFTPENYTVSFSEYIFEGETTDDALASIEESLGISVGKLTILEGRWDNCDPCNQKNKSGTKEKENPSKNNITIKHYTALMLAIIIAGISLLISLFIHFQSS